RMRTARVICSASPTPTVRQLIRRRLFDTRNATPRMNTIPRSPRRKSTMKALLEGVYQAGTVVPLLERRGGPEGRGGRTAYEHAVRSTTPVPSCPGGVLRRAGFIDRRGRGGIPTTGAYRRVTQLRDLP